MTAIKNQRFLSTQQQDSVNKNGLDLSLKEKEVQALTTKITCLSRETVALRDQTNQIQKTIAHKTGVHSSQNSTIQGHTVQLGHLRMRLESMDTEICEKEK
jgi:predicted  nucleic acid-binding Zn-ribbon protein